LGETLRAQEAALKRFNNAVAASGGTLAGLKTNLETAADEVKRLTEEFNKGSAEE
jgi:hypothetical protein